MELNGFDSKLSAELIEIRRDLHRYPESGWTEFRTTVRIIEELQKLGLPVRWGRDIHVREKMFGFPSDKVLEDCWNRACKECTRQDILDDMRGGYTGCVTEITGAQPGPTIGIRVDIDSNDVEETTDPEHIPCKLGFRSVHSNLMHACGHDAHTAIGIGTARLLCANRDKLHGKVILIFQPGEEGLRGAASMTAAGLVSECDYFFGGHVGILPNMDVGTVAAGGHGFLSSTKFDAYFHGVPSHAGASPEMGRNAVAAGAMATLGMLSISRHHEGATRINIGTFNGGTGRNVIPAEAHLTVETRGGNTELDHYMVEEALRVCRGAAEMCGCTFEEKMMGSAGGITCDTPLVKKFEKLLAGIDGVNNVLPDADFGGCEDITTMMREVQSHGGQATEMVLCMPLRAPHHNDKFDVDERVIPFGAKIFATLALELSCDDTSAE